MQEYAVSQHVQAGLTDAGGLAMRNNVGAAFDHSGRPVRYGLMNESAKINKRFKSCDLIDCIPIVIQPHHVGRTFGLFTAIETKKSDWKLRPSDEHAQAQLRFINLIRERGGMADFMTHPDQLQQLMAVYR